MALAPNRQILETDITYFVNSITGTSTTRMERGGILCAETGTPASGAALDSASKAAEYATNASGRVALGILENDFTNIDYSRQTSNQYKDELQIGNKATIVKKGWVVTNMIESGAATGTMPATAYAGPSGLITTTVRSGYPAIGLFRTRVDNNGYAEVAVNFT